MSALRLHIQNPPHDPVFSFTDQQWRAALGRSPDMDFIEVSISNDAREFDEALEKAEVLLTWVNIVRDRLRAGDLQRIAPRLRIISCNSAGVDRLAPFDWLPSAVTLLNNSGIHSDKAGEFGLMALLMLHNQMPRLIKAQAERSWNAVHASTIRGRRLCIVGMGSLGSGVARRARALGMYVIGVRNGAEAHPDCDETVAVSELDSVLPRVDDVLLACPLTEHTRNLLSRERIAKLRRGARVVNIARGAVWDQEAICDALESEQPPVTDFGEPAE